jgi:hypothetical protein
LETNKKEKNMPKVAVTRTFYHTTEVEITEDELKILMSQNDERKDIITKIMARCCVIDLDLLDFVSADCYDEKQHLLFER